jgi:hypothetical protein
VTRDRVWLTILAALGTSLILALLVPEVDARGRGGGGRSFSRGGAASRGSMTRGGSFDSRSSMPRSGSLDSRSQAVPRGSERISQQPRAEQRPAEGDRRDRETRQDDRQEHQNENREDWQSHLEEQQEKRLDQAEDWQDEYMEGVVYPYGYPYGGTSISISITNLESSGCTPETVMVQGSTYYRCETAWYKRAYTEGNVSYVEVRAPSGY